jgi:hypothetical protein
MGLRLFCIFCGEAIATPKVFNAAAYLLRDERFLRPAYFLVGLTDTKWHYMNIGKCLC